MGDKKDRSRGDDSSVPRVVVSRLPKYYRYLGKLLEKGVEKVSSQELSDMMGISASQLRQDLSYFGTFGQKGYGYNVETLHHAIRDIIGLGGSYLTVIVGAGNLGQALANYPNFSRRGFKLKGIFDINPRLIGLEIRGVQIRDVHELEDFVSKNDIDIGIITVPEEAAQDIADKLVCGGVRGIWNFAPIDIQVPPEISFENEHLLEGLLTLSFAIKDKRRRRD